MKTKKIPDFNTDKEIADFWDSRDFADYVEATEPVSDVVFEKPEKSVVAVRMDKNHVNELKSLGKKLGLGYTSIIRSWVIERLAKMHNLKRAH